MVSPETMVVTIEGPQHTLDLELPGDMPIRELIPALLELCGPHPLPGDLGDWDKWKLGLADKEPFPASSTFAESEIVDGAILILQDVAWWMRHRHRPDFTLPPVLSKQETSGIGIIWNKLDLE